MTPDVRRRTSTPALDHIREVGIVPVIRTASPEAVAGIADALVGAGLPILEITMTVPQAIEAIAAATRRFGASVTIGAGTVTTPAMAEQAIAAGCTFLVTPCLLPEIVAAAQSRQIPIICGALTPTEVFLADRAGADLVKVFPSSAVGGPAYIRGLKGPLPDIDLVATGGISLDTVADYFRAGVAAVGVGGELIAKAAVAAGNFAAIADAARAFVAAAASVRQTL